MNKSFRGNLSVADARIKNEGKEEEEKEKKEEYKTKNRQKS